MIVRISIFSLLAISGLWGQVATVRMSPVDEGANLLRQNKFSEAAVVLQDVVDREPGNLRALWGLVSATFVPARASADPIVKQRGMDATVVLIKRILELSPNDEDAYVALGVVDWVRAEADLKKSREQIGMNPPDPGPLKDFVLRQEMRARFEPAITEGIDSLQKAMQIDNKRSDAMAYMNLLLRARADIDDTAEQAAQDVRMGDDWAHKAIAAKQAGTDPSRMNPLFLGPPPSPAVPGTIRIGGKVAAANLVSKVDPVYPPLARQAQIQGTVIFNTIIGKDGHIENLTLVSGHPLLAQAAQQAAQQWIYRPTLLNGQPVAVITTIDVKFSLQP